MALKWVAFQLSMASTITAGLAPANTMGDWHWNAWRAIVHAPMWNSGYMHTVAPRGSICDPGWVRR